MLLQHPTGLLGRPELKSEDYQPVPKKVKSHLNKNNVDPPTSGKGNKLIHYNKKPSFNNNRKNNDYQEVPTTYKSSAFKKHSEYREHKTYNNPPFHNKKKGTEYRQVVSDKHSFEVPTASSGTYFQSRKRENDDDYGKARKKSSFSSFRPSSPFHEENKFRWERKMYRQNNSIEQGHRDITKPKDLKQENRGISKPKALKEAQRDVPKPKSLKQAHLGIPKPKEARPQHVVHDKNKVEKNTPSIQDQNICFPILPVGTLWNPEFPGDSRYAVSEVLLVS